MNTAISIDGFLESEALHEHMRTPVTLLTPPQQGNLNRNVLFETADGRPFLLRTENDEGREKELPIIEDEYKAIGFLEDKSPNTFFVRSVLDQHIFADRLAAMDVPVIPPVFSRGKTQIIAYCQGARTLAEMWERNDDGVCDATRTVFHHLLHCHRRGIAIGDRWGPNELILPDGTCKFIDFDIGIAGPDARTFELASLLYFLSYFAQKSDPAHLDAYHDVCIGVITSVGNEPAYNSERLLQFLKAYPRYGGSGATPYSWGGTEECERFFSSIRSHV